MRSWVGHGKGRVPGQPNLTINGGPGMGGGRAGSQPVLDLNSGPGMGSGRPGRQANLDIEGGPGMGGGRAGSQPNLEISGGPGKGGGRAGSQPTIDGPVDFGEGTQSYNPMPDEASSNYRGASSSSASTTGGNKDPRIADPEGNYVFALVIGSSEVGYFMECSGLKTATDLFEIQEGGINHRVHKLAGQSKWENIVLKYGVTSDGTMLSWRNEVLQDQFSARRNGAIVMMNQQREEIRRYNFVEAWPVSWEGPSFSSAGSEVATETLEIAHNGIQVS